MPKTIACGQARASASTTVGHLYDLLVASLLSELFRLVSKNHCSKFCATGATVANFACLAPQAPLLVVWRQIEFGAK